MRKRLFHALLAQMVRRALQARPHVQLAPLEIKLIPKTNVVHVNQEIIARLEIIDLASNALKIPIVPLVHPHA
jgi:hypothetical protein